MKEIRIEMTSHGRGKVFADGQELHGITVIKFESEPHGLNRVTLTFIPKVVVITGPVRIVEERASFSAESGSG